MVKTFKNLFLRNQEIGDLETWYTASGTQVLPICFSNDDTGLTLIISMTWPNLFPNASAWVKAYAAYTVAAPIFFQRKRLKNDTKTVHKRRFLKRRCRFSKRLGVWPMKLQQGLPFKRKSVRPIIIDLSEKRA